MGGEVVGEPTLYERIGGIFAIAAVINDFSDRVVRNQTVGDANPELHQWHTDAYKTRLPGLKWGRTFWVASAWIHRVGVSVCAGSVRA